MLRVCLLLAFVVGLALGCAAQDPDHATAFVSSCVSFAKPDEKAPDKPSGPCQVCKDTGCAKSGDGLAWLQKCPGCGKTCSRVKEAPSTVGDLPITLFVRPIQWQGNVRPEITNPRVGDIWQCTDGHQRRWGENGKWQVKRCYGPNNCRWEDIK